MSENFEKKMPQRKSVGQPLPLAHLLAHHSEHLGCQTPIRNLIYMTGFIYPLHSDLAFAKARWVMCIYLNIYIYIMYTNIFFVASNAGWQNTTDTKNSCSQVAINNPFRWIFILRCRGCLDTSKRRRNLSGARINQDEWKWRSPSILLLARV